MLHILGTSWKFVQIYRYTVESVLNGCIMAWLGNSNVQELKRLQRVVDVARSITGTVLRTIEAMYRRCCFKKAANITQDPYHPGHTLIPSSGRRWRNLKTVTTMFKNSFFQATVRLLNTTQR